VLAVVEEGALEFNARYGRSLVGVDGAYGTAALLELLDRKEVI
jgi:hypothetical protein